MLDPTDPTTFLDEVETLTAGRRGERGVRGERQACRRWPTALEVAGFRARLVYIGIDVGGSAPARLGLFQSKELQARGIIGSPGVLAADPAFPVPQRRGPVAAGDVVFPLRRRDEAVEAVLADRAQVKVHITSDAAL